MIIKQYNINNINNIGTPTNCKVGVSISEDDYYKYRPNNEINDPYVTLGNQGFHFKLNEEDIYIGLTFKYQSDTFLDEAIFDFSQMEDNIPKSILIQILQKE